MITKGQWENFLTLEGEKLLLVIRKHVFVVIFPIFLISLLAAIFIASSFILFTQLIYSLPLFVISSLLIISTAVSLVSKQVIDWYFHVYILTSRKMLEMWYVPLSSHVMNDILLDKVDCTEVDLRANGLINDLLDMGDVVVTFDRPTHQEEFVIKDVRSSDKLVAFLTQKLMDRKRDEGNIHPIWFKERHATIN